jgi:hypothetical protein
MGEDNFISANVYKDDSSFSIADRVMRHYLNNGKRKLEGDDKERKKLLANYIEQKVNGYIQNLKEELQSEIKL